MKTEIKLAFSLLKSFQKRYPTTKSDFNFATKGDDIEIFPVSENKNVLHHMYDISKMLDAVPGLSWYVRYGVLDCEPSGLPCVHIHAF